MSQQEMNKRTAEYNRANKVSLDDEPHPEAFDDELFMGNIHIGDYPAIGWANKRVGLQAYDVNHNVIPDALPLFVKRWEIQEFGITIRPRQEKI